MREGGGAFAVLARAPGRAAHKAFETDALRWAVKYKWGTYGRLVHSALFALYGAAVLLFSAAQLLIVRGEYDGVGDGSGTDTDNEATVALLELALPPSAPLCWLPPPPPPPRGAAWEVLLPSETAGRAPETRGEMRSDDEYIVWGV